MQGDFPRIVEREFAASHCLHNGASAITANLWVCMCLPCQTVLWGGFKDIKKAVCVSFPKSCFAVRIEVQELLACCVSG